MSRRSDVAGGVLAIVLLVLAFAAWAFVMAWADSEPDEIKVSCEHGYEIVRQVSDGHVIKATRGCER